MTKHLEKKSENYLVRSKGEDDWTEVEAQIINRGKNCASTFLKDGRLLFIVMSEDWDERVKYGKTTKGRDKISPTTERRAKRSKKTN